MGRKQYQSQGRYAGKKRRPQKSGSQESTFSASPEGSVAWDNSASNPRPEPTTGGRYAPPAAPYPYVVSDLIHTIIIALIAFVILIVIYLVL